MGTAKGKFFTGEPVEAADLGAVVAQACTDGVLAGCVISYSSETKKVTIPVGKILLHGRLIDIERAYELQIPNDSVGVRIIASIVVESGIMRTFTFRTAGRDFTLTQDEINSRDGTYEAVIGIIGTSDKVLTISSNMFQESSLTLLHSESVDLGSAARTSIPFNEFSNYSLYNPNNYTTYLVVFKITNYNANYSTQSALAGIGSLDGFTTVLCHSTQPALAQAFGRSRYIGDGSLVNNGSVYAVATVAPFVKYGNRYAGWTDYFVFWNNLADTGYHGCWVPVKPDSDGGYYKTYYNTYKVVLSDGGIYEEGTRLYTLSTSQMTRLATYGTLSSSTDQTATVTFSSTYPEWFDEEWATGDSELYTNRCAIYSRNFVISNDGYLSDSQASYFIVGSSTIEEFSAGGTEYALIPIAIYGLGGIR